MGFSGFGLYTVLGSGAVGLGLVRVHVRNDHILLQLSATILPKKSLIDWVLGTFTVRVEDLLCGVPWGSGLKVQSVGLPISG